jgi:hypothetical protein
MVRPALTLLDGSSVAVLPFQNIGGDYEQGYLARRRRDRVRAANGPSYERLAQEIVPIDKSRCNSAVGPFDSPDRPAKFRCSTA